MLGFPPLVAAEKLIGGDIDAAFIVTGWNSPAVQSLINANSVELTSFDRADAMVALYPFLTKVTLPRGIFDLANDRPPADIQLPASKSILAVRADLHSAHAHSGHGDPFPKPFSKGPNNSRSLNRSTCR